MEIRDITLKIKVTPQDIDFINKIIEAYEGIALVSTVDAKEGILKIHTSPGNYEDLQYILDTLPRKYEII
ncbi:MAG: hypothetical protein JG764_1684 [Clostridiales bacterium]|jgi:hypothetical protein|nr:hypothetical protein [Clostridiales bacterium]